MAAIILLSWLHRARTAEVIFELAAGGVEGIADGDMDVLVGVVFRRVAIHHDLAFRHGQVDPDMVDPPLPVMSVS